ncbi:MAG: T9SS type A sorting domain-containing protein, partial [Bacteroidetes bacterium]|nr:T9SS type A sorting domain-containing protein [Bacteroidota bacterium]MBT7490290.1 T9SS type A sorting domain-containing protein [Bacteroidota bacterium]
MKTKIFILTSIFFISTNLFAQQLQFDWAAGFTGETGSGTSFDMDSAGNIYSVGGFSGTGDFDPGSGVYNLTSNYFTAYISKLDAAGNFVFANRIGNGGDVGCADITINLEGNFLIIGRFADTLDLDFGPGEYLVPGPGMYIAKYNSSGDLIWAKAIATNGVTGVSISTDAFNNIYISGKFTGIVDFDTGPNVFNLSPTVNTNNPDIFILKLDSLGDFLWAKQIGGEFCDYAHSMCLDNIGNVYVTGEFKSTTDFDPGPGVFNLSAEYLSCYIVKLNSSGNFVWANTFEGGMSRGHSIVCDNSGYIYVTGNFSGTVDFDPDSIGIFELTPQENFDVFISKIDTSGTISFVKHIECYNCISYSIALDATGNIYTTGYFHVSVDLDPAIGIYNLYGNNDIFISKLDVSGNFAWAGSFGSTEWDYGRDLKTDHENNVILVGGFHEVVDFDPGPNVYNLSSTYNLNNYSQNAFVLKLSQCSEVSSIISESACFSYYFNDTTITSNGTYYDTITNGSGCDSIITLNVTFNYVDTSVTQNENTLTANSNGATYQWTYCGYGNMPVIGETNQSFTPTINGSYAVIITENGCTDTSSCYTITTLGITENKLNSGIKIYPNPFSETTKISFYLNKAEFVSLEIFDITGKKVRTIFNNQFNEKGVYSYSVNMKANISGIYLAKLTVGNEIRTK